MSAINLKMIHIARERFTNHVKFDAPFCWLVFYVNPEDETASPGDDGFVESDPFRGYVDTFECKVEAVK